MSVDKMEKIIDDNVFVLEKNYDELFINDTDELHRLSLMIIQDIVKNKIVKDDSLIYFCYDMDEDEYNIMTIAGMGIFNLSIFINDKEIIIISDIGINRVQKMYFKINIVDNLPSAVNSMRIYLESIVKLYGIETELYIEQ